MDESNYNPFHYANITDKKTLRGLQALFKIFWENWKVEITVIHNSVFMMLIIWFLMAIWTLYYYQQLKTSHTTESKNYQITFKKRSTIIIWLQIGFFFLLLQICIKLNAKFTARIRCFEWLTLKIL